MYTGTAGHPPVPLGVASDDAIGIVSIHHPRASDINRKTQFIKTERTRESADGQSWRTSEGCDIFLHPIDGQPCFTLGRGDTKSPGSSMMETRDVYFPGTTSRKKHFILIPVWDLNLWRLQSVTETVGTVNGVPIQAYTNRTKNKTGALPQAIHMKQASANHIIVNGLHIDIWLLKSVRDVYPRKTFTPEPLKDHLQNVAHRPEQWAHNRYFLGEEQVSARSYQVIERFTGEMQTAKLFPNTRRGRQIRDQEFLNWAKREVDASIAQYLQSVEVESSPAIMTASHEGYASYATLRDEITAQHLGVRFSIATRLLRRLFSALNFIHFHGIVHRGVSQDSVLLRIMDRKAESVLLVNYSNAASFSNDAIIPHDAMVEDGRAAMAIIENCCDIWGLRKAATRDAMSEEWMRQRTETAKLHSDTMQRVISDFFEIRGGSRTSDKGKRLLRLLEQKQNLWHSCQNDQIHNATRRDIGVCYKSNIDEMASDWNKTHPSSGIGEGAFFNLSLGHPWFDNLASQLYHGRWDTTPYEVCAKFKELAGDVEEPWQTFEVKTITTFKETMAGLHEKCVMAWLASCCEVYPEWREALETEYERNVSAHANVILRTDISKLRDALSTHGRLPPSMAATLNRLTAEDNSQEASTQIEETHHVSLHLPSRMFNATQLLRLASFTHFFESVDLGKLRCDNYVEVRGEPKLQGCYISLALLSDFSSQLGLNIPQIPGKTSPFPTLDPSDFSQVAASKIVLARVGLVAFASVTRTGDQYVFHAPKYPKEFATRNAFLPTYFGNMEVLPRLSDGVFEYFRPEHWSAFQTVKEIEHAANTKERKILLPKGRKDRLTTGLQAFSHASSPTLPGKTKTYKSALSQLLDHRQLVRAQARLMTKRNTDSQSSSSREMSPKRRHTMTYAPSATPIPKAPSITMSFINRTAEHLEQLAQATRGPTDPTSSISRISNTSFFQRNDNVNANVLVSPSRPPADVNQLFTVVSGSFNLDKDWMLAD